MLLRAVSIFGCISVLAACGGGGDGDSDPPPSTGVDIAAVAVYKGRVDAAPLPLFETVVINADGRLAVYYEDGFGSSRGFVDGVVSGNGGSFSGRVTDYSRNGVADGTVSGTYRPGVGVTAQVRYPIGSDTRTYAFESYPTSTSAPRDLPGTWNAVDEDDRTIAVSVNNTSISVNFAPDCSVTGTVSFPPNTNITQVATLNGTALGGGCRFGTGAMSGTLLFTYTSTGTPTLRGHFVRADRRDGFTFRSYRCRDGKTYPYLPLVTC